VGVTGVNLRSILVAVVGSVIVLVAYHAGDRPTGGAISLVALVIVCPAKIVSPPEPFARPCALHRRRPRPIHNISNDAGMRSRLGMRRRGLCRPATMTTASLSVRKRNPRNSWPCFRSYYCLCRTPRSCCRGHRITSVSIDTAHTAGAADLTHKNMPAGRTWRNSALLRG
jgi:hypothetical protein